MIMDYLTQTSLEDLDSLIEIDRYLMRGSRAAIVLIMLMKGFTKLDIADCLGVNRKTVERDAKKAREYLRKRL